MKLLSSAVLMFIVLAFVACTPVAEEVVVEEPDTTEADLAAIEQYFLQEVAATNAGDLEAWVAGFAEDIVLMPPNEPTVGGRDGVRAWGQPLFEAFDMEETQSAEKVEVAGDWAFALTTYNVRTTPKEGGEATVETGRIMWIMERQPDGAWQAAWVLWNSDSPPAEQ